MTVCPLQSRADCIEGRAEIHKQNPGVGSRLVQVQLLYNAVKGKTGCDIYRHIGSELQGVQKRGHDGLEMVQDQVPSGSVVI